MTDELFLLLFALGAGGLLWATTATAMWYRKTCQAAFGLSQPITLAHDLLLPYEGEAPSPHVFMVVAHGTAAARVAECIETWKARALLVTRDHSIKEGMQFAVHVNPHVEITVSDGMITASTHYYSLLSNWHRFLLD